MAGCISWSPGNVSEHYEFQNYRNRFQLFLCLNYTQYIKSSYNKVAVLVCLHFLFVKFLNSFQRNLVLDIYSESYQTNMISVFRFS
jgi:hypothetical protein